MPDTKQFRNALAAIKSQTWVNMGATRNPMLKQALRHVAGAHDFSSSAATITGINKKIETVKISVTIHLSKEDRSYVTLAFVFENNEKLCRIDRRYYDAKLKAHFLPDENKEFKGAEPNAFISNVFAYAAQFAASMASGGHSNIVSNGAKMLSPSTSNGISAIAATVDPKQDRETQEMFAKRITEIAEKIGFDDTKTFVISQKAGGAKPVVFVSLKRVGDDAYVKDYRAFRVDGITVTEYDPDILKARGLVKSKLGVFRVRKLESELQGIFEAFVEKHGATATAGVAVAGDELSDRVASIVYGDLKRIKSTIAAWKGKMPADQYKEFVAYQTSVAKFIAKTMIPKMSEAYQAKVKSI